MKQDQIKRAMAYAGATQTNIAKELGYTQANFSTKIKRESLNDQELENMAQMIGAKYKCYFEFDDGTKI